MTFGERLREARIMKGYTQKQLAEKLNIGGTTVTGYEKDNSEPSMNTIGKIMEILDVDANFLFQDESSETTLKEKELSEKIKNLAKKYRDLDTFGRQTIEVILDREIARVKELNSMRKNIRELEINEKPHILYLSDEDAEQPTRTLNYYQRLASAGTGQIVFDDVPVDLIEIPDVPEYNSVKYAIGVNGDSMEPLYYDGDILLVEPMQDIRVGEIGIFIVGGESLVKKRGQRALISLNKKKKYPEIPIDEETRCLGRVVDKISTPDSVYAAMGQEDFAALEQDADLLRAQAFDFVGMADTGSGEYPSGEEDTSPVPDMSAFAPEDLAALDAGVLKMFKHGKKA